MTKQVTHIDVPSEWESTNDWDSHRPMLYLSVSKLKSKRFFVEFGAGNGSTKLLSQYCEYANIFFSSFDTDKKWAEKVDSSFILDFDKVDLRGVDTLFIDGKPGEQRKELIKKWANEVNVILCHDTEPGAEYVYGMAEVLSTFKYRLDYCPEGKPWTTAVSNFVDVTKWVE